MAAKERHRRVGVAVEQGRGEVGAGRVDHLVAGLGLDPGSDLDDQPVLAAQADRLAIEKRAAHREAAQAASSRTADSIAASKGRPGRP